MSEAGEGWERDMWPIKIWEAKVIQKAQNWAKKKKKKLYQSAVGQGSEMETP